MHIEQQLPFSFENDMVVSLDDVTDFDEMIYDPKGFVLRELKRTQLNVSNQNRSTSRVAKPPITKGNPATWDIFSLLVGGLVEYYRTQTGSCRRSTIGDLFAHLSYAELNIDKKTKAVDWTTMFMVTTAQAPIKASSLPLNQTENIQPNTKTKPWAEQSWQQVDNGAFIPPPLKSVAFAMQTEHTERFSDTVLFNIHYELNRGGYHTLNQNKSLILIYGPSTEYRKIGLRLCYLDSAFNDVLGDASKLKKELDIILLPGSSKSIGPANTQLIKQQFRDIFEPDPLNREMFGDFQYHSCMAWADSDVLNQLWGENFSARIKKATNNLKKLTSAATFKLFINNIKGLKEESNDFNELRELALISIGGLAPGSGCVKCCISNINNGLIQTLVTLVKYVNINTVKEIIGDDYLVKMLQEHTKGQRKLKVDVGRTSINLDANKTNPYRLKALRIASSVDILCSNSVFSSFTEARKLSILKSIYDPETKALVGEDLNFMVEDTTNMLAKVEKHKHSKRGLDELKKRDIRSLKQLHDELSYVIQIMDTIPRDITHQQYAFLDGKLDIPFTNFKIVIPKNNVDIKTWGTQQRHCIGSYADDVIAERRVVIGVWDKAKEQWYGHMSFSPLLSPGAKPNANGKLDFTNLYRYDFRIQQFYGLGNKALDRDGHAAVHKHIEQACEEWLFKMVQWSPEEEEIIESNELLSLMRSERRVFYKRRLDDGTEAITTMEKGPVSFARFVQSAQEAITIARKPLAKKKMKSQRNVRMPSMRQDERNAYDEDIFRDLYRPANNNVQFRVNYVNPPPPARIQQEY